MTTQTSHRPSIRWNRVLIYALLIIAAAFYLLPVYVLVVTGMKGFQEVSLARMWDLPSGLHFDSFAKAWFGKSSEGIRGLSGNFMNSVYLAVPATLLSAALGSMNGYVLAKWKFKGFNVLFPLMLFGMFIPYQSILIPLVQVLQKMHLYGSLWGLIFVHIVYGIPITTLTFYGYYMTVPKELVEAARIDGAGMFGTFANVFLPISAPGFVVVLIWQFTSAWNDFLFAVILTGNERWPVTVALQNMAGSQIIAWNVQMAGSLLAALPTLLVYIFLGRYFLRGLMAGALKG